MSFVFHDSQFLNINFFEYKFINQILNLVEREIDLSRIGPTLLKRDLDVVINLLAIVLHHLAVHPYEQIRVCIRNRDFYPKKRIWEKKFAFLDRYLAEIAEFSSVVARSEVE